MKREVFSLYSTTVCGVACRILDIKHSFNNNIRLIGCKETCHKNCRVKIQLLHRISRDEK